MYTSTTFTQLCSLNDVNNLSFDESISFNTLREIIVCTCVICGNTIRGRAERIKSGKIKCPICNNGRLPNYDGDMWLTRYKYNNKIKYDTLDFTRFIYVSIKTPTLVGCITCGNWWNISPDNLDHGYGCPKCGGTMKLTTDQVINQFILKHGDLFNYDEFIYHGDRIKGDIICNTCGIMFKQNASNHKYGSGCPHCKSSHGERDVHKWLTKHNIKHEVEYTYDGLIGLGGGLLRFDFYLPDTNTCIEFDGGQHYDPKHYLNSMGSGYDMLHEHDIRKNEYCDKHNIRLIRIGEDDDINDVLLHFVRYVQLLF